MKDKNIKITKLKEKEWKWLSKIKLDFDLRSVNDVVYHLHKFINKLSLMKDLQIQIESEVKVKR